MIPAHEVNCFMTTFRRLPTWDAWACNAVVKELPNVLGELQRTDDVIDDVPVVGLERRGHDAGLFLNQIEDFAKGHDQPTELDDLLLQLEDSLLDFRGHFLAEDLFLDVLGDVLQALDNIEVPVHHLVQKRVQKEPPTLFGEFRLHLPPPKHRLEVERGSVAKRYQVARPDEGVDLLVAELTVLQLDGVHY